MKTSTYKLHGAGKLLVWDRMEDKTLTRKTRKFLIDLLCNVARGAVAHWDCLRADEKDHPLTYHERGMYSLFAAALSKITPLHLSELSVQRKSRFAEGESGRVDFWAHSRKVDFLLEIKAAMYGYRNGASASNGKVRKNWAELRKQTDRLASEAKGWSDDFSLIGLQVLRPYATSKYEEFPTRQNHDPYNYLSRICGDGRAQETIYLKDLDFSAVWLPRPDMTVIDISENTDRFIHIPFVAFNAFVKSKSKRR